MRRVTYFLPTHLPLPLSSNDISVFVGLGEESVVSTILLTVPACKRCSMYLAFLLVINIISNYWVWFSMI